MRVSRLVLGTTNPGKISEWSTILSSIIPIVGIASFGQLPEPDEDGATFAANAQLKASHYAKLTHEFVLADDGGYEIDVLGGWPGVKSRRILPGNREGTDADLIRVVLQKMAEVPQDQRTVRLTAAVAVANPRGEIVYQDQASFEGLVTEKAGPVLIPGYPFRSIHWIPDLGKTYAELTEEEHTRYSHRRVIAQRLAKFLLEYHYA